MTIYEVINTLNKYWEERGYTILPSHDARMGAATFHPKTFFTSLENIPRRYAYHQICRRPEDSRYGSPQTDRMQRFLQYQVIHSPYPANLLELYEGSLQSIGINLEIMDLRYIEDNWSSTSLGAYGTGCEVALNGVEVTQITKFSHMANIECPLPVAEIAYGLERLLFVIPKKLAADPQNEGLFDLKYDSFFSYKDLYLQDECELSKFCYLGLNAEKLKRRIEEDIIETQRILQLDLPTVAYDVFIELNHNFNLLVTSGVCSHTDVTILTNELRKLASDIGHSYLRSKSLKEEVYS